MSFAKPVSKKKKRHLWVQKWKWGGEGAAIEHSKKGEKKTHALYWGGKKGEERGRKNFLYFLLPKKEGEGDCMIGGKAGGEGYAGALSSFPGKKKPSVS